MLEKALKGVGWQENRKKKLNACYSGEQTTHVNYALKANILQYQNENESENENVNSNRQTKSVERGQFHSQNGEGGVEVKLKKSKHKQRISNGLWGGESLKLTIDPMQPLPKSTNYLNIS